MKALTIQQPWAEMIVSGQKRIENRYWSTRYRGPLLIHAGKGRGYLEQCADLRERWLLPADSDLIMGALIGIAELVDCVQKYRALEQGHAGEFTEGPICWILRDARRFERPLAVTDSPAKLLSRIEFESGASLELRRVKVDLCREETGLWSWMIHCSSDRGLEKLVGESAVFRFAPTSIRAKARLVRFDDCGHFGMQCTFEGEKLWEGRKQVKLPQPETAPGLEKIPAGQFRLWEKKMAYGSRDRHESRCLMTGDFKAVHARALELATEHAEHGGLGEIRWEAEDVAGNMQTIAAAQGRNANHDP